MLHSLTLAATERFYNPDLRSAGILACFLDLSRLEACATPGDSELGHHNRAVTGTRRPALESWVGTLDPTTAGNLKRFKRVEVNALHPRKSHL